MTSGRRPSLQDLCEVKIQQSRQASFWATIRLGLETASFMVPLVPVMDLLTAQNFTPSEMLYCLGAGVASNIAASIMEVAHPHEKKPETKQKRLGFQARYLEVLATAETELKSLSDADKYKSLSIAQIGTFMVLPDYVIAQQPLQLRYQIYYAQSMVMIAEHPKLIEKFASTLGKGKPISSLHMNDMVAVHELRNKILKLNPAGAFAKMALTDYHLQSDALAQEQATEPSVKRQRLAGAAPALSLFGAAVAALIPMASVTGLHGAVVGGAAAALISGAIRGKNLLNRLGVENGRLNSNWQKPLAMAAKKLSPYLTEYSQAKPKRGSYDVSKWKKAPQID